MVIQRIELLTSDQAAGGSNPSGRANLFPPRERGFEPEPAPTNRRKSPTFRRASAGEAAGRPMSTPTRPSGRIPQGAPVFSRPPACIFPLSGFHGLDLIYFGRRVRLFPDSACRRGAYTPYRGWARSPVLLRSADMPDRRTIPCSTASNRETNVLQFTYTHNSPWG